MDSYITWTYQIADHNCRITSVYNKINFKKATTLFLYDSFECGETD